MILQPLTRKEHDSPKYVVDVYGRTHEGDIARVRLVGFKPYFYIRELKDFTKIKTKNGYSPKFSIEEVFKSDVIQGFNSLKKEKFFKLSFETLWGFKLFAQELKKISYESNFPPYLKLIHERNLNPASPFEFSFKDFERKSGTYEFYDIQYAGINPAESKIPLYIMAYDLEVYSETGFPQSDNPSSEIMQIGVSTRWTDNLLEPVERFVLVSGKAISTDPSLKYICCSGERDLLLKFQDLIKVEEPDIITGYNTFGFDDSYLYDRFQKYHLEINLGREDSEKKIISKTFELASGKYAVRYLEMNGRLSLDLLLYARREFNLDSYKLDNVAGVFLRDKVQNIIIISGAETRMFEIHTKSTRGLFAGNYVKFDVVTNTSNPYAEGKKFYVKEIFETKFIIELDSHNYLDTFDDLSKEHRNKLEWSFCKDDVSIRQIMDSHHGTTEQKSEIARYCIQDCDLVLTLLAKLDVLTNSRGMADVCRVPLEFIFANRGQGIRIYSAVLYEASKQEQIIRTQECAEGDISYEGAIVIEPKIGMYLDTPIAVLDYNSLYPSNMIAYNLSPDTLVYVKTYSDQGKLLDSWEAPGIQEIKKNFKLDEISYDHHGGRQSCGYVQEHEGLLPRTLKLLLKKRKDTRKLMESEKDESQKSVLNGLQLAYKTVANSIYGQTGSRTSPIRRVEVAACTTAIGRERLLFAKKIAEEEFQGQVIYGDTDSIFINFNKSLQETIDLAKVVGQRITSLCRSAHKIDYEKTFFPFLLFCRKRYAGLMYEDDVKKCKRKFMGISLKRRDSAPIVKDIYGGALDILLEQRSLKNAESFVKDSLVKVLKNEIPLEKFIITKQLRDDYKNPEQIAHRVLADRMTLRDPGNIPQVGERLAFIYVSGRSGKQGDRIENVDYVREKKLKPDSEFYITNQIQNPLAQLFALGIEQLSGYSAKKYPEFPDMDEEERTLKILSLKEKELDSILFTGAQYLRKEKRGPLDSFFSRK